MAKQAVGTLERHVEKGILGVAALVLIAAIAKFLIVSPNRVELPGAEAVSPATVDDVVLAGAERVRQAILQATPQQKPVESPAPAFEARLDPYRFASLPLELPRAVMFQPPTPVFATMVAVNVELVTPLPLPKPILAAGRSCLAFEDAFEWTPGLKEEDLPTDTLKDYSQPVNWVTVSALWDRDSQIKANEKAYARGRHFALSGGTEIQRRAMRPDGSWSDEDWKTIKPYDRAALPALTDVPFELDRDGRPTATAGSIQAASQLLSLIEDPVVQMNLLRPLVPAPACGEMWSYPSIAGSDVLVQDDEYHWPEVEIDYRISPSSLIDRYPRSAEDAAKILPPWVVETKLTPEDLEGCKDKLREAEKTFMEALATKDKKLENNAYNFVAQIFLLGQIHDPSCADTAKKLLEKMESLSPKKVKPTVPGKTLQEKEVQFIAHPPAPQQQVWAVDGQQGSVVGGQTYQYRIRMKLLNPYYGQPQSLKNPEDAKVAFVDGDWSEPSDPIYVEPDTQYFARSTSRDKDADHVTFDMYKWYDGLWVKGTYKLGIGDLVGGETRVQISEDEKPTIPFDAGALVLDLSFDRPWCGRGKAGREGLRFAEPKDAESVVLVDASGNITERLLELDRATPKQKDIASKLYVYKAPKKEELPGQQPNAPGAPSRGTQPRGGSSLGGMGYGGGGANPHGGEEDTGGRGGEPRPRP